MADDPKPGPREDRPLGQVLMEQLAVAMVENNRLLKEFKEEVALLREQLEDGLEVNAELSNQLGMGFRILDYLTGVGADRRIHWGDVADILGDLKKEAQEQDAAADAEEAEEEAETPGEGDGKGDGDGDGKGDGDEKPPEQADPKEETKKMPVPIPTSASDEKKPPQEIFTKPKAE
jgi:hypothetical protein